jgi:hypothetical protein
MLLSRNNTRIFGIIYVSGAKVIKTFQQQEGQSVPIIAAVTFGNLAFDVNFTF